MARVMAQYQNALWANSVRNAVELIEAKWSHGQIPVARMRNSPIVIVVNGQTHTHTHKLIYINTIVIDNIEQLYEVNLQTMY